MTTVSIHVWPKALSGTTADDAKALHSCAGKYSRAICQESSLIHCLVLCSTSFAGPKYCTLRAPQDSYTLSDHPDTRLDSIWLGSYQVILGWKQFKDIESNKWASLLKLFKTIGQSWGWHPSGEGHGCVPRTLLRHWCCLQILSRVKKGVQYEEHHTRNQKR